MALGLLHCLSMRIGEYFIGKLTVMLLLQCLHHVSLILNLLHTISHLLLHHQLPLIFNLFKLIDLIPDVLRLLALLFQLVESIVDLPHLILLGHLSILLAKLSGIVLCDSVQELGPYPFVALPVQEHLKVLIVKELVVLQRFEDLPVGCLVIGADRRVGYRAIPFYQVCRLARELTVDFEVGIQLALVHGNAHSVSLVVFAVIPVAEGSILASIVGLFITDLGEWGLH